MATTIEKARAKMITQHGFLGSVLLSRPFKPTDQVPLFGVDERATIYYNPENTKVLSVGQCMFGLGHEALHVILLHAVRRGGRLFTKWNVACDYPINDILRAEHVGEWIPGILDMPGAREKTAEQVYESLPDNEGGGGQGGGQGGEQGNQPSGGGGKDDPFGDDIFQGVGPDGSGEEGRRLTPDQRNAVEAELKGVIAAAAQAAKMRGNLPAAFSQLVEEILSVRTPWYDILERFMTHRAKNDYSFARPNRRFLHAGLTLPSMSSQGALGTVVIGVDTSGSVSQREMSHFAGHITRIFETCKPEKVYIVYCDARVAHVDEYDSASLDSLEVVRHGGGGTAFKPVFDWATEHGIEPDVMIYLTDGYGDQQSLEDYGFPTVWLTTGNTKDFAFGEVVEYEVLADVN